MLASCQPAWTADLSADGELEGASAAATAGLRAGFAFPVQVGTEVVAILEFLSTETTGPDDQLLNVMATASTQLGRVVERSRAAAVLSNQAMHDPLTGLPNRILFLHRLGQTLSEMDRESDKVAVLFVDLDGFKLVNDSLGHASGDAVPVALARRIQGVLRSSDTVARFGGDEFTILCQGLRTEEEVLALSARVSDVVAQPLSLELGFDAVITTSIGIAFARDPADGPEVLLRDADVAMYPAKDHGGARHEIFDVAMHTQATDRLETVSRLRRAADRGELRLFYQPQVSLTGGGNVGSEALIRWQHPERGLLTPDRFIPLAEESQLIVPIGQWVVEEACRQAMLWCRSRPGLPPLKMAVIESVVAPFGISASTCSWTRTSG